MYTQIRHANTLRTPVYVSSISQMSNDNNKHRYYMDKKLCIHQLFT